MAAPKPEPKGDGPAETSDAAATPAAETDKTAAPAPPGEAPEWRPPAYEHLKALEQLLKCRVLTYYATTVNMSGTDASPLTDLLDEIGSVGKLAVVMQSPGGDPDAAHHLANLIREYAGEVHVYIPTYAASAATIFSLTADELWMGRSSELSPIDPLVPVDPALLFPRPGGVPTKPQQNIFVPALVIRDFLEWAGIVAAARKRPDVDVERLAALLPERPLNPWVLGLYERFVKVSRIYAHEALVLHLLKNDSDREERANEIVDQLLEHFVSHEGSITRGEARRLKIPISDCPAEVWKELKKLDLFYRTVMEEQGLGRVMETTTGVHALPSPQKRTCRHCSTVYDDDDSYRYCPTCGKAAQETCKSCDLALKLEWKHCPRCGTPVA